MKKLLESLEESSAFSEDNANFLEELYERFLRDPNSVDPSWQETFSSIQSGATELAPRAAARQPAPVLHAEPLEHSLASLASENAVTIETLQRLCEQHRHDAHGALGRVAREFLNDWDVILRPVSEPWLPLTNNEAERALRHYVISRLISHGTRSAIGSRAFALLASVIETCRRRGVAVLDFLGSAIAAARKGLALPEFPEIQVAAG